MCLKCIKTLLLVFCGLFISFGPIYGQALKMDFPNLYPKFEKELSNQGVDFIFVIDNSGSMRPFGNAVRNSIRTFINSVPPKDYVSIILFDRTARGPSNSPGFASDGPMNRNTLTNTVNGISFNGSNTDLGYMFQGIKNELNRPGGTKNKMKFIFVFTDFYDQPGSGTSFPVTSSQQWLNRFRNEYRSLINNNDFNVRAYPISLPLGPNQNRHIAWFQQLLTSEEYRPIGNISQPAALTLFFNRIHDEIDREKLKAVVSDYCNKSSSLLTGYLSCGGKLVTYIHWDSKGLYKQLNSFSFNMHSSGLYIDEHKSADRSVEKLAFQIKYDRPWLPHIRRITGRVDVTYKAVFNFSNEFATFGIKPSKDINTSIPVDKVIFIHILPWWLDIIIILFIVFICWLTFVRSIKPEWVFRKRDLNINIKVDGKNVPYLETIYSDNKRIVLEKSILLPKNQEVKDFMLTLVPAKPLLPFLMKPARGTYLLANPEDMFIAEIVDVGMERTAYELKKELQSSKPIDDSFYQIKLSGQYFVERDSTKKLLKIEIIIS